MAETTQMGWASTKPGRNKYHFYTADGQSLCSYERQPGPLHFEPESEILEFARCEACNHPRHLATRRQVNAQLAAVPKPAPTQVYALDMVKAFELRSQYQADVVLEQEDCANLLAAEIMKPALRVDIARGKQYLCLLLLNGNGKDNPDLTHWMATELLQFSKMPQVRVGSVRVPCGKEIASGT